MPVGVTIIGGYNFLLAIANEGGEEMSSAPPWDCFVAEPVLSGVRFFASLRMTACERLLAMTSELRVSWGIHLVGGRFDSVFTGWGARRKAVRKLRLKINSLSIGKGVTEYG